MDIILGVLEEGFIYGILALGVYITYSILDFPDLSVDSTFPLGSVVTAVLILKGVPAIITLPIAFLAGALAGTVTGLIHVKLKVRDLLSGIIMMTGLYSINLAIAQDKANLSIFGEETIFENSFLMRFQESKIAPFLIALISFFIVIFVKILLDAYLKTRSGYLLRAVGDNETIVTSLAKDKGMVKIIGLALANGFVALAGSVYCQKQGFFDITTGTGSIVIGLASVIIGTKVLKRFRHVKATTAVILGTILYKACVSIAIALGMRSSYLKLITAILFLVILLAGRGKEKR
ncbi:MAG: ABC transporter permease [Clostridiales bacterium]|nr:ABC transporter permease [Clostridiales bacterium]